MGTMNTQQLKVVIPQSGGMDSTYMMFSALSEGIDVYPIILDQGYGKEALLDKGLQPAMQMCIAAGLQHRIKILPFSPTSTMKIADGKYGYTPGLNLSIAMAALSYAEFVGATEVWLGYNASQEGYYPDQKYVNFKALADVYNATYGTKLSIQLPLSVMTRTDVAYEGHKLGIPFEKTVSCVTTPIPMNCGRCARCQERRAAFIAAEVPDNTLYMKD